MNKDKVVIGVYPLSGDLGPVTLRTVVDVLESCAKWGFREFDVAPNYGNGFMEECLGKAFGSDESILINTKCGAHPFVGYNFDAAALEMSFEQSLKRLRRDKVQTLFLHNPRLEVRDLAPALDFLEKEKKRGRIQLSALSEALDHQYDEQLCSQLDAIQVDVNLLYLKALRTRAHPDRLFYARSILATGILSGRLTRETVFEAADYRSSWLKGERLASILKRVKALQSMSNIELPSLARRFVFQLPQVDKVILGVKKPEHVKDIMTDLESEPLSDELMQSLIKLHDDDFGLRGEKHLGFSFYEIKKTNTSSLI